MNNFNRARQGGKILVVPILLTLLAAGLLLMRVLSAPPPAPERATVLPEPMALPEFSLVDQDATAFTRDSFRDRWSLVFFGFTHCPDICPATLQQLAIARRRVAEADPGATLPDIVLVTVDPARDTSAALGAYVSAFGDGVIGVTGDPAELKRLADALGIYFSRSERDDGNYSVDHSAAVIVVNDDAEFHAVFSAPHDVDSLAADIPRIIAAR